MSKENQSEQKFEHQTGGHEGSFLKQGKDKLMKPVSQHEVSFYTKYYQQNKDIQRFAPKFFGTETKLGKTYVIMEDLTHLFKKPCVIDIKIGTSSAGEDASVEKRAMMEARDKSSTTATLGMRISGFRVYHSTKGEYIVKDKEWSKTVTEETMEDALSFFFSDGKSLRKSIIQNILTKLHPIKEWMESQRQFRFYSSSVLILYDGDEAINNSNTEIRLIDFAHVHPITDGGRDEGYIIGITNLIKYLRTLVE